MKMSKPVMSVAALLFALFIGALPALAQEPDAEKKAARIAEERALAAKVAEVQGQIQAKAYSVIEAKLAFEAKLIKGAPYSAMAVSESVQVLGDGNRIRQTSTTVVYRDSAGRTRREMMKKDGTLQSVVISDPATGINYTLDPQTRTAMKSEFGLAKVELDTDEAKRKVELERKLAAVKSSAEANGPGRKLPAKENLGRQTFEGVEAEGSRTTTTIPAGQIGNDLPINIVSEQWYSPELQLLVMTKHSDPRTGETTYRLTNINRAEPDRSLFEVPSDYTMRNLAEEKRRAAEELRIKLTKPEER